MDLWLAPAGLWGGQILEAKTRTSPPATHSSPLPPLLPRVQKFLMDWAAVGRKSLLRRDLRRSIVSSMRLSYSLQPRRWATALSTPFSRRGATALSTPPGVAAPLLPVVAAPVCLGCRDLLHSALASGRLCQVRAARHCSFLDSVLELLTDDPPVWGSRSRGSLRS